jgi:hypothetical protein
MAGKQFQNEAILQTLLEMIQKGEADINRALEQYPEQAGELRPLIETALWLQESAREFEPLPGFIHTSRQRLISQIQRSQVIAQEERKTLTGGGPRWWENVFGRRKLAYSLVTLMMLCVFLFTSVSGVAYASQSSLPGGALYPLKTSLEQASLTISLSQTIDARLHIRYAERRISEVIILSTNGEYARMDEPLANYEGHVEQAIQLIQNIAGQDANGAKTLADSLQQALASETQQLSGVSQAAPQNARPNLEHALQVSQAGVASASQLIEQLGGPTPTATATKTKNTPPPQRTPSPTNPGVQDPNAGLQPPLPSDTFVPPGQAKKTETPPTATEDSQVQQTEEPVIKPSHTPKPSNTHKPTQKPHPTQKPTKEPKPSKTPKK